MQFSLRGLLESRGNLRWEKKLSILNDVCHGLQYLHSRNPPIIYRNLTPNNILLCSHLRAKISDLGIAKLMCGSNIRALTNNPGTEDFMPPESFTSKPVHGLPLDMFSFGGVILYICTHQWPQLAPLISFDPDSGKRIVLTELERRQEYLDQLFGVYTDLKSLAISCLDDNPVNRPSVEQVLQEIQVVKNAYEEKLYCAPDGEQSTTKIQDQQEQKVSYVANAKPGCVHIFYIHAHSCFKYKAIYTAVYVTKFWKTYHLHTSEIIRIYNLAAS